jgi:O-antigen ligase
VYPWAYWPLALFCIAAGAVGFATSRARLPSLEERRLSISLAAIAVAALLQTLPLPTAILEASGPRRLDLIGQLDVGFALGLAPTHALSLAPWATIRAALLYIALAVLMLGLMRCLSARSAVSVAWVITCIGIALAVTGVVQRPLYNGSIYGFWKPLTEGRPFGPFVNRNHFAGWMVMAIPLALGYCCGAISRATDTVRPSARDWLIWFSSREANRALLAALSVILMAVALVLSLSRSGMVSLAAGLIVCCAAALRRQQRTTGRAAVSGAALVTILIVMWAGADTIAARFAVPDTVDLSGRIPIWRGALDILRDFWLAGSGLNTFGVTTLFYPTVVHGHHLAEAHNDYLQLAIEGGLLLGAPIVCALVVFGMLVRRRLAQSVGFAYWIRLGAVGGIAAVAVQSFAEFSLQIPGNAALFATLCALAAHRTPPT